MKKVMVCVIPVFLAGITLSHAGFVAKIDSDSTAKKCEVLGRRVLNIAATENTYSCEGDVKASGIALQEAGRRLKSYNFEQAFRYLKIAEHTLTDVFEQRQFCSYFSPRVKLSLDEIINLHREIPIDERVV